MWDQMEIGALPLAARVGGCVVCACVAWRRAARGRQPDPRCAAAPARSDGNHNQGTIYSNTGLGFSPGYRRHVDLA